MTDGNCSFCHKPHDQVFRVISSNGAKICNECIGRCAEMIAEEYRKIADQMQIPPTKEDES
jgi:ATP-dependent protease Clp ATPase subunit